MTQEYRAKLSYLRISARKTRLVADLVRGMDAERAMQVLTYSTKRASSPVQKLLESALANAKAQDGQATPDKLVLKEIRVDEGPILKRYRARSRGRAFPIEKRTSHISLVLTVKEGSKEVEKEAPAKKPVAKKPASAKSSGVAKPASATKGSGVAKKV